MRRISAAVLVLASLLGGLLSPSPVGAASTSTIEQATLAGVQRLTAISPDTTAGVVDTATSAMLFTLATGERLDRWTVSSASERSFAVSGDNTSVIADGTLEGDQPVILRVNERPKKLSVPATERWGWTQISHNGAFVGRRSGHRLDTDTGQMTRPVSGEEVTFSGDFLSAVDVRTDPGRNVVELILHRAGKESILGSIPINELCGRRGAGVSCNRPTVAVNTDGSSILVATKKTAGTSITVRWFDVAKGSERVTTQSLAGGANTIDVVLNATASSAWFVRYNSAARLGARDVLRWIPSRDRIESVAIDRSSRASTISHFGAVSPGGGSVVFVRSGHFSRVAVADVAGDDLVIAGVSSGPSVAAAQSIDELTEARDFTRAHADLLRLYRAFFDREPDVGGARYWIGVEQQHDLDQISEWFTDSQEFQAAYAGTSNTEYLRRIYQNVLGRQPDEGGFNYWLGLLESGSITRAGVVRFVGAGEEFRNRYPYGGL